MLQEFVKIDFKKFSDFKSNVENIKSKRNKIPPFTTEEDIKIALIKKVDLMTNH